MDKELDCMAIEEGHDYIFIASSFSRVFLSV